MRPIDSPTSYLCPQLDLSILSNRPHPFQNPARRRTQGHVVVVLACEIAEIENRRNGKGKQKHRAERTARTLHRRESCPDVRSSRPVRCRSSGRCLKKERKNPWTLSLTLATKCCWPKPLASNTPGVAGRSISHQPPPTRAHTYLIIIANTAIILTRRSRQNCSS